MNNIISYGEILWDLLPSGALPGGAPMNVAYHLQKLGQSPALISRIGLDKRGKDLLTFLKTKNVNAAHVQLDYHLPTGIVHATANVHGEMQYDIVSPVAWDNIEVEDDTIPLVKQADYFIFGSLAARNKTSRDTLFTLLEDANTKVLDINLRAPHFNRAIVESLLQKADILKMNESELQLIADWFGNFKTATDRITMIQQKFDIPNIIVTLGADGALMNTNGNLNPHKGFKVKVADTIGSGDSFLAAMITSIIQQRTPDETLTFACALGALVASRSGGCPDYLPDEIHELINKQKQL
ncbi:carbohydrate kinase family protein [Pinibacter soli]|uniref:Carbohydrate kinase n=1 Tax=Pinibacter soli TaxID=3044211 RepID=A0ABT6RB71_9BACT|nr:carbohydrate kinase [Pinibacter soli]MDI3319774.1 carbohydrate kinase [Pinibacter soli]